MILSEFSYKNASGWTLEKLSFNHQNLVVGMNAVGKSRTVSAIGHVASFIKGDMDAAGDFSCSMLLENGNRLEYSFDVVGGQVLAEVLEKNGIGYDEDMVMNTNRVKAYVRSELNSGNLQVDEIPKGLSWWQYSVLDIRED